MNDIANAVAAALKALVARSEAERTELPLDVACLHISLPFDERASVARGLTHLDELADAVGARARGSSDPYAIVGAAIDLLFAPDGFRGDDERYDQPDNSLLSRVLERRAGIPITLSILLIEICRRLGVRLDGIGLPGHFVVRFPDATSRLYIDAFRGGRIIEVRDCVALVERVYHNRVTWRDDFLEPVPAASIVKRVLLNLRNALTHVRDYSAALAAIELQLAVDPHDPTELRDRGILFARLRRYDLAIADLEAYLLRAPDAGDRRHIRTTVEYLRQARYL